MTVSVVMICKDEADVIADTIRAAQKAATDIVALDSGSTDGTQQLLQELGVRVLHETWTGFGRTKNTAIKAAQHDWILQLDADERIDETLADYIKQARPEDELTVYNIRFRNYLGDTPLLHGEWGTDKHIRLFNRKRILWNNAEVHEELVLPAGYKVIQPPGYVHHVTAENRAELRKKMDYYARLSAEKYQAQGKKYSGLRMICSPPVNFIINYFFKLGFLDGRAGWVVARESARYTWLKYRLLNGKR
jgi:glycosyltransferase involved in cell wall biosynthesis